MRRRIKKRKPGPDRRQWTRLKLSAVPFLKGVNYQQTPVEAIDISQGGLLLETQIRLRPMISIQVEIVARDRRVKVYGTVVRSKVISLNGGPTYQSAVQFDEPFGLLDDMARQSGMDEPFPMSNPLPQPEAAALPEIDKAQEFNAISAVLSVEITNDCQSGLMEKLSRAGSSI